MYPCLLVFGELRSCISDQKHFWKEQVLVRPRGSAPALGALCRVEIRGYFAPTKLAIPWTLYS
jgi:hypothetical protein